jgi:hypothetical protein
MHGTGIKINIQMFRLSTGWTIQGSNPGGSEIVSTLSTLP